MLKSLLILVFIVTLTSCGLRITNYPAAAGNHSQAKNMDSVLILKQSMDESLLNAGMLIGETEIKAPLQKDDKYTHMLGYAKNEAAKQGGNVVKVVFYHGILGTKSMNLSCSLKVKIYFLDQYLFSTLRMKLDSTESAYRNSIKKLSLVHIKNLGEFDHCPFFFNDSLVASIGRSRVFKRITPVDLVFDREGVLSFPATSTAGKIPLKFGQEYFVILYSVLGHHTIEDRWKLVDKDTYEYNPY